jgi:hypothetical protein
MRRNPRTPLVCLLFFVVIFSTIPASGNDTITVQVNPPTVLPPVRAIFDPGNEESPEFVPAAAGFRFRPRAQPVVPALVPTYPGKPITKCSPSFCPSPPMCQPAPCGPPQCILPSRKWGQIELFTQVYFPRISGMVRWPSMVTSLLVPYATTDIDLNDDLGIPKHKVLLEYHARCQIRPHWSIYYSIMPISLEGNNTLSRAIAYGIWVYPAGTHINTKWNYTYQRVALAYQPIDNCNARLSIFGGWLFDEQWLHLKSNICGGHGSTIYRTRHQVVSGIDFQRCIRTTCNGLTVSCDNRFGISYLDNTLGIDVQTGLQFSVPMNAGRWGFARGGYRWLNFSESRTDLRLDVNMVGGFVEAGLIF